MKVNKIESDRCFKSTYRYDKLCNEIRNKFARYKNTKFFFELSSFIIIANVDSKGNLR